MPVKKNPRGHTTRTITVINLNTVAARRTIPGDDEWPAIEQLTFATSRADWNLEVNHNDGMGWRHLQRVARGGLVNLQFDAGTPEPGWRLVEVPA